MNTTGTAGQAAGSLNGIALGRFAPLREAFAANFTSGDELGASFCATVDGETVVDLWGGWADEARTRAWQSDTIVNVYSTTKTMTALVALLLADRGELDFEAPVARYWPEFAANGKAEVKVSHLMSHSAGLPDWHEPITNSDLYDWEKVTRLLAEQAPDWVPGTEPGYHSVTFGYLVGEVVRRVTGRSLGTVFRQEIAEPLGADFYIGLPASEDARVADLIPPPGPPDPAHLRGRDGYANQRMAWRRNSGDRRHGQRSSHCRDPRHPGEWRRRQGQAVSLRGGMPQGAGSSGLGARSHSRIPDPQWAGVRGLGRRVCFSEPEHNLLGRVWRIACGHRYGCSHLHWVRDEQNVAPEGRHARPRTRHGDLEGAGLT